MNAVVYERYGPPEVLRLEDVEKPSPGSDEVLVRVEAAGVATGDRHLMRGDPLLVRLMFGLRTPKLRVLGSDIAGRVETVGGDVREFQPGDEVFGHLADAGFGGFADYVCAPPAALAPKPEGITFDEAAAIPGSALAALQGLRDAGRIRPGQEVLVNGASGGVGVFAVQIAKSFGARVTGVCSTRNVELVRSLGADRVIDYSQEDFRDRRERYDLILDAAAYRPVWKALPSLARGGAYVLVGGSTATTLQAMLLGPALSAMTGKTVAFFITKPDQADLVALKDLVEQKKLAPVIDRRYPLRQVPDAIRHLETGRARGKLVVTTARSDGDAGVAAES